MRLIDPETFEIAKYYKLKNYPHNTKFIGFGHHPPKSWEDVVDRAGKGYVMLYWDKYDELFDIQGVVVKDMIPGALSIISFNEEICLILAKWVDVELNLLGFEIRKWEGEFDKHSVENHDNHTSDGYILVYDYEKVKVLYRYEV